MCSVDCFLFLLALLFPPLPVWVKRGICSADSLINIALCCLGVLPGLLHSWYIIAKYPDPYRREYVVIGDGERGSDSRSTRSRYSSRGTQQHDRTVYTIPAPREERAQAGSAAGYGAIQQQQQQPSAAGPSSGTGHGAPPSYASVVAGDNKVQH